MECIELLRSELVSYIRKKFYSRRDIAGMADEIVNQTFLDVMKSPGFSDDRLNFGYMSLACIRTAYKVFRRSDRAKGVVFSLDSYSPLIDEDSFAEEIEKAEDAEIILDSLEVLREIERIVVTQRYYGDFSFAQIAKTNGLNLNTVLSHHRRALSKLRPQLTKLLGFGKEQYYDE